MSRAWTGSAAVATLLLTSCVTEQHLCQPSTPRAISHEETRPSADTQRTDAQRTDAQRTDAQRTDAQRTDAPKPEPPAVCESRVSETPFGSEMDEIDRALEEIEEL